MIYGIKNWNKSGLRYSQNNNSTEAVIRKIVAERIDRIKKEFPVRDHAKLDKHKGYLETCSATSFCTILEGLGVIKDKPRFLCLTCQAEDFFIMHANDPEYDSEYNSGLTMDNRDLHTWEKISNKLGLATRYIRNPAFSDVANELMHGNGCMILFPGHYCAAVAYDKSEKEILYMNPWDGDPRNKNGGRLERITASEWDISRALAIGKV